MRCFRADLRPPGLGEATIKLNRQAFPMKLNLPVACITDEENFAERRLVFSSESSLTRAWALGIFYLQRPEGLDLAHARQFGVELTAADSKYRALPQYSALEGFISLNNNQQTKLALSRRRWAQHYPAKIANFGRRLDDIGIVILREVLRQARIPPAQWGSASGGYISGAGTAFLNFVYYDTKSCDLGLRPHTDYGFITILDASAPGLQIEVNGKFEDVPVNPGHLIINFGEALSFITEHTSHTVHAVRHQVLSQRSVDPIRHGIVYFANPDLDGLLRQFDAQGEIRGSSSVGDLFARLEKNLTETS